MGGTAMLAVRDLSVAFQRIERWGCSRRIEALRGLSLELHPGEVVAVVGSSGAGKSVLAHAILGILPSNAEIAGEILYRGEVLTKRRLEQLRGREIVLLPQSITFLDPLVKAKHAVRWAARMSGMGRAEARAAQQRAFLRLGLPDGVGDRVLLAMATVGNARLLVADEPTPGLHPEAVQESLQRLRRVADQGSAVLLISHDIAACLSVADRVAVFLDGAIVEVARSAAFSGQAEQLLHRYSRALWSALPQNLFLETPAAGGRGEAQVSGA
jgi:peptide/nickel transport system ATP-binding protein